MRHSIFFLGLLVVFLVFFLACGPAHATESEGASLVLPGGILNQIVTNRARLIQVSLLAVALGIFIMLRK